MTGQDFSDKLLNKKRNKVQKRIKKMNTKKTPARE